MTFADIYTPTRIGVSSPATSRWTSGCSGKEIRKAFPEAKATKVQHQRGSVAGVRGAGAVPWAVCPIIF